MAVRDTLAAVTSNLINKITADVARIETYRDPYESEESTLLDYLLEDLARCKLPPDPTKRAEEEPFEEFIEALERFVDVFFVPVVIIPEVHFGTATVMTWFELWEAQFHFFHQGFSLSHYVEGTLHDVGSLAWGLRTSHATAGSVSVPTPDGDATLTYERTPTGWSTSLTSPAGEELGFPHKLCLLTMDIPPGEYNIPVSIHDMLLEPRTYQLGLGHDRNSLEQGSGSTWWPRR